MLFLFIAGYEDAKDLKQLLVFSKPIEMTIVADLLSVGPLLTTNNFLAQRLHLFCF